MLFCLDRNKLDIVQTDVVDDPTLQRSKNAVCEKCNYNEAVFFQADEVCGMRPGLSKAMQLKYIYQGPLFLNNDLCARDRFRSLVKSRDVSTFLDSLSLFPVARRPLVPYAMLQGAKSQSLSLIFVCTNRACGHKWVS